MQCSKHYDNIMFGALVSSINVIVGNVVKVRGNKYYVCVRFYEDK